MMGLSLTERGSEVDLDGPRNLIAFVGGELRVLCLHPLVPDALLALAKRSRLAPRGPYLVDSLLEANDIVGEPLELGEELGSHHDGRRLLCGGYPKDAILELHNASVREGFRWL